MFLSDNKKSIHFRGGQMNRTRASLLSALIVAIACFGTAAFGQQLTKGTLKGTVADPTTAVVPGAKVTVRNDATGATVNTTTDNDGAFAAADLLPGTYTVTVEKQGYKKTVQTNVNVVAAVISSTAVVLAAGNISEVVTVTGAGEAALETESSQVSGTINTRKVEDLPSNGAGGGIDTLALLVPGVTASRANGSNTNGTALSVNGNRTRSNNFQIDGQDNNDLSVGGPALFVDFQDSVQEYQVITNNFSAQYGRNQGAVVNIVTKAGTNDYHGSLFEFHQDAYHLNSLDNIEKRDGQLHPDRNLYNVFGGTVGGPIWAPNFGDDSNGKMFRSMKNKAFFFFGYQGVRNPASTVARSTAFAILPSEFSRLSTAFPGGVTQNYVNFSPFAIGSRANTFSTAGQSTISTQFQFVGPGVGSNGLPNGSRLPGCPFVLAVGAPIPNSTAQGNPSCGTYVTPINPQTGQPFLTGGPFDVYNFGSAAAPNLFQAEMFEHPYNIAFNENYWQLRFDVRPTNKDTGSIRYIHQFSDAINGTTRTAGGFHGDLPAGSKNLGGDWTHQFSNKWINTFRASHSSIIVDFGGGCQVKTPGCVPSSTQLDQSYTNISFAGFTSAVRGTSLGGIGPATNLPQGRTGTVTQLADTVTYVRGSQTWTMGFEFKKLGSQVPFLPIFNGAYTFRSAGNFINNAPSALSIAVGDPLVVFPEKDKYAFFQDDWKVRPNLTLNLGVRYENTGQPINALHDITVARETSSNPLFDPSLPLSIRTVPKMKSDNNNFAPRVGFAYVPHFFKSLLGQDATVIRGGFSIAYEPAFYNILLNIANAAPFAASITIPPGSLVNAPGTIYAIPNNAYGDAVRAAAVANGIVPPGALNPLFLTQTDVASDFHQPYSEQWSLGVQHQFGRRYIAEARYVGTHGVGLFQSANTNFFVGPLVNGYSLTRNPNTGALTSSAPNSCPAGSATCVNFPSFASQLPPGTTAQVCTNDPATPFVDESACNNRLFRQGSHTTRGNWGQSIYHALQTQFKGRFLRDSLDLGLTYTWSKSIDNASEIFAESDQASANAQRYFCTERCERGLSAFDKPHAFTANWTWDIPFYKEQKGIIGHLAGGWQLNGTYILTSGSVFTPFNGITGSFSPIGTSYLTAGDRPFVGNPSAALGTVAISQIDAFFVFGIPCSPSPCGLGFWSMNALQTTGDTVSVTPNDVRFIINGPGAAKNLGTPFGSAGRSILRGPIVNQVNLSLFKNIRIGERWRVQLRGEAFNAFNHPNPGIGTGSGGDIPDANLVDAGVPGSSFGNFQDIEYARRVIQVAIRITW
jgi:outer membrane receptor protein involved in Fe transport